MTWRQVILAHLGHFGYPFTDHRMICGSSAYTAFTRREGSVTGKMVPQAVPDTVNVSPPVSCGRPGWPRRALQTSRYRGNVPLPLGYVEVKS